MHARDTVEAIKDLKHKIVWELTARKHELRVRLGRFPGPANGLARHELKIEYDWKVRPVARATFLTYGLLRGRRYKQIEQKCDRAPDAYHVMKILHEFGSVFEEEWPLTQIRAWLDPVPAYVNLWEKVYQLNARGENDSEEACNLRELGKYPWGQMTSEDREEAQVRIDRYVTWKKQVAYPKLNTEVSREGCREEVHPC